MELSSDGDSDFVPSPEPKAKQGSKKTAESAGKAKQASSKATKSSKGSERNVLGERDVNTEAGAGNGKQSGKQRVEDIYQKKSQLEHILLRPDTYIGSTERCSQTSWVMDGEAMQQHQLTFVPGLYKIFDEVLVNAADNKVRDPSMKELRVDIDQEKSWISVYNDGAGIPVEVHKEEGVYVPELIFGHLLTSSNYDDSERKVTGGRNGFGAKLANIFSEEFVVETSDGNRRKAYRQVFQNNMQHINDPDIKSCKATENWTRISFRPELSRFHMDELEDDVVQLMKKRVHDLAGTIGKDTKIFLNGKRINVKGFSDYIDLFLKDKPDCPKIYERVNDRWEVCISASEGSMQNVSFVNSINTIRGGTHVNYIADQVATKVLEKLPKKDKTNLKPIHVKNNLFIFVNALIENPAFDSQTKETLITRQNSFGSKCEISDKMINQILKSPIKENILSVASQKQSKELKKSDGAKRNRLSGIPKLDDANDAGTKKSEECTLILTEGDSAKALAVAGLSVLGRDKFGVFPLRGKLLNVRDASHQQVMNNQEVSNLKQILGLQQGKAYTDAKSLRYGHVMIMTDQDHDGSHIKGLLINFFHHFFPSLLRIPGFLLEFITPIVKASKGKHTKVFYSMPEYEEWRASLGNSAKGWTIKYYKGLGTSTSAEAKEYFAALQQHRKVFRYRGSQDDDAINMAFSRKKVEERKTWMNSHHQDTYLDHSVREINFADFVNKELILFSLADLQRSIPNLMDGLKTSQRKVMFGAFKKKMKGEIKVAQLSGYVSEHSAYHHGEASLASTIVSLAQDFVGSNNINLLHPAGQFGTRLQGGKDHASPRYIFTKMGRLTRYLFMECDEKLLNYLSDDGQRIEPEYYLPILPLALINGAEGIGTGWSTHIPNYNPKDVAANVKRLLRSEELEEMKPWFRGFQGTIEKLPQTGKASEKGETFVASGIIKKIDENTLEITELPIRTWTQDYKEFLESLVKPSDKNAEPLIQEYKEYHTDTRVHFILSLTADQMKAAEKEGLEKRFKMHSKLSTSNMHLFNEEGTITRYNSPQEVLEAFFKIRMDGYERRRSMLIAHAEQDVKRISNKVRFILEVVDGKRNISRKKKAELEKELERDGFDKLPKRAKSLTVDQNEDDNEEESDPQNASYDYLLSMPLWSLTHEKVEELQLEKGNHEDKLAKLKATSAKELWEEDIDNFLEAYEEFEKDEAAAEAKSKRQAAGKGGGKAKKSQSKKARLDEDDDDDDDDEDFEASMSKGSKKGASNKASSQGGNRSKASTSRRGGAASQHKSAKGEDEDDVVVAGEEDLTQESDAPQEQGKSDAKKGVRPASKRGDQGKKQAASKQTNNRQASQKQGRVRTVALQREQSLQNKPDPGGEEDEPRDDEEEEEEEDKMGSLIERMASRFGIAKGDNEPATPQGSKSSALTGADVAVDDNSPGPQTSPTYPPNKRRAI